MAEFRHWLDRYEAIVADPEQLGDATCPHCGGRRLDIALVANSAEATSASAALWCRRCLTGIEISRVPLVSGVELVIRGAAAGESAEIQRFKIVPPSAEDF